MLHMMSARHAKTLLLLLIVLVALLFFFHAPSGGFQSVNGPTAPVDDLRFAVLGLALLLAAGSLAACGFRLTHPVLICLSANLARSSFAGPASLSLRC
jgi:hypothetical protein